MQVFPENDGFLGHRISLEGIQPTEDSEVQVFPENDGFLGHRISLEGIQPTEDRVKGILAAPVPQNKSELKSFIGLMSYNSKFLPSLATVLHPLYKRLRKESKWMWSKEQELAVRSAREMVSKATVLVHCDPTRPIKVYCDALSVVLACFVHILKGKERPVMYASRTLSQAETNYAQIEREALAIIFAVQRFHQYLYGRDFVLVTDHRPLCKIFGHDQAIPSLAAALGSHLECLYMYTIQYIPGEQNSCPDCLECSRVLWRRGYCGEI